jgi:hypothetical protein
MGGAVAIDLASRNPAKVRTFEAFLILGAFFDISRTDTCPDTRKHVHLSSQPGTTRTSSSRPFLVFVSPEMGFSFQNPTYTCDNANAHAQRCPR